jgi:sugar (pentulose or hexulose) kinase
VPPALLPELVPPGRPIGPVTPAAGAATGLRAGLPVIAGAADKGAEGLGCGCLDPSSASLSLGTAATAQVTSRRYFEPLAHMPPYPAALAGHYSPEVQVSRGYWLIAWFLREFAGTEREEARRLGTAAETLLDRLLEAAPAGSLGLVTLPHCGARLRDPDARGALVGLGGDHTRAHLYRSLIEGLAFALRDGLERLERAGGVRPERITVSGGASQSPAICQITADVLGRELWTGETFEATGLGAAVLAAAGAGLYPSPADAARAMVRPGRAYRPEPRASERYRQLYLRVHRRLQGRLAPLHRELGRILAGGGPEGEP